MKQLSRIPGFHRVSDEISLSLLEFDTALLPRRASFNVDLVILVLRDGVKRSAVVFDLYRNGRPYSFVL